MAGLLLKPDKMPEPMNWSRVRRIMYQISPAIKAIGKTHQIKIIIRVFSDDERALIDDPVLDHVAIEIVRDELGRRERQLEFLM